MIDESTEVCDVCGYRHGEPFVGMDVATLRAKASAHGAAVTEEAGGRLVVHFGAYPVRFSVLNGEVWKAERASDLCAKPDTSQVRDVVVRAKAALEDRSTGHGVEAGLRILVRELVAAVERLRAALPPMVEASTSDRTGARVKPVAEEGRVWLYRSDADGAEALVRFHAGEWQTADPALPARWYSDDAALLEWSGRFVELERGLLR